LALRSRAVEEAVVEVVVAEGEVAAEAEAEAEAKEEVVAVLPEGAAQAMEVGKAAAVQAKVVQQEREALMVQQAKAAQHQRQRRSQRCRRRPPGSIAKMTMVLAGRGGLVLSLGLWWRWGLGFGCWWFVVVGGVEGVEGGGSTG